MTTKSAKTTAPKAKSAKTTAPKKVALLKKVSAEAVSKTPVVPVPTFDFVELENEAMLDNYEFNFKRDLAIKQKAVAAKLALLASVVVPKSNKRINSVARKAYAMELITSAKHQAKQIVALLKIRFPEYKYHTTLITDSKNPKYTAFGKVSFVDKTTGNLRFAA